MFGLFKSKDTVSSTDSSVFKKLSILELENFKDEEIYSYLKKAWNIDNDSPIRVWGHVSFENNFYNLYKVRNLKNEILEYPVLDLEIEKISHRGIYLDHLPSKKRYQETYISCNLRLSSRNERKKRGNPLHLQVDKKTIEICSPIPLIETIENNDNTSLIEESIIQHLTIIKKDEINKRLGSLYIEKQQVQTELAQVEKDKAKQNQNILEIKQAEKDILATISQQDSQYENLKNDIQQLHTQLEKDKQMKEENLKQMRDFVKSKATPLLELEFINQAEYDKIMGHYENEVKKEGTFLDFDKDFKRDYSQATSHIQAYLFNQNTVYYRYLLEDYFTSIQTNDLIILAGDSGSGKTNLVKKFAEVVGGVAKIIPVKPNWTSSDDLLGYYNPLQKSYLSTPFLDALIEAHENPTTPYFICLDEMNLARVEYYFADFLSILEEREKQPIINLYSDAESTHTISEFNHVLSLIQEVTKDSDKKIITFIDILKNEKINNELKKVFGFGDKDSLIKYHSDLRRMISGILNTPASITFPKNVRIIGTINIDETTHYLSPKILDRAHVIKLDSPSLSDWSAIEQEVIKSNVKNIESKINFNTQDFGLRESYPQYSPKDSFCSEISKLSEKYLNKLGIDVSLRAIRQGLKYNQIFSQFNSNNDVAFNNFILHKILPKFTFDGNRRVDDKNKHAVIEELETDLKTINSDYHFFSAKDELGKIIKKSQENDGLVNYWA